MLYLPKKLPWDCKLSLLYMQCRKRKCSDRALELGSDGLATVQLVKSIKCCGFCGDHFMSCMCKGLDQSNMILHPAHLPQLPAAMLPADHLYRWHVLYQATSIMTNYDVYQTEYFLKEYTGAVVHFATKNKQLLVAAANAYVANLKKPFSWDAVKSDLVTTEKALWKNQPHASLKQVFGRISINTVGKLKAFVVNAAEIFGDTQWSYMSTLHVVFVRMLLTRATAIPLAERRIMAGLAAGFWDTHLTLINGFPWLALDNSKQQLKCLF